MAKQPRVLIAGESWSVHSIHQKGFDSFTTTEYAEGVQWLRDALEAGGWDVTYQPAHVAARDFPTETTDLAQYDCVMLSDIGANTLLLHPDTFGHSKSLPNRLHTIRQYVKDGGGLIVFPGDRVNLDWYHRELFRDGNGMLPQQFVGLAGEGSGSGHYLVSAEPSGPPWWTVLSYLCTASVRWAFGSKRAQKSESCSRQN